jgi:hypothetical protein
MRCVGTQAIGPPSIASVRKSLENTPSTSGFVAAMCQQAMVAHANHRDTGRPTTLRSRVSAPVGEKEYRCKRQRCSASMIKVTPIYGLFKSTITFKMDSLFSTPLPLALSVHGSCNNRHIELPSRSIPAEKISWPWARNVVLWYAFDAL